MAFETINLGTQPAGTGGDTARSAFEKTNRNFLAAEVLSAAMSQAQFEAIRAQNNEEFAASGFVHFGKHWSGQQSINEGLYPYTTDSAFSNILFMGRNATTAGLSKTNSPVLNIAGVLFYLQNINTFNTSADNKIKFPQAPDGKNTYNKSSGVITTHATVTAAFNAQAADPTNVEVVTDRVDMWGFEAWLEEVNTTNPYIYPNGLIQSQATTMDGIATSASARPVTYYAVFDGDTGSKGKGLNYFALSDANKKKVLANYKNNLYYLDDGRLVQWRLRQRTVAGAGNGDWGNVDCVTDVEIRFTTASMVRAQGFADVVTTFVNGTDSNRFTSSRIQLGSREEIGLFVNRAPSALVSVSGECYFLACGTVSRLNQGAYHPSFNPSGTAYVLHNTSPSSLAFYWYNCHAGWLASKSDCFTKASTRPLYGGAIGGFSHHPTGKFFDAIYADGQGGVCRDMRYSAYGVDSVDFAEADQKVKNGTYRGFELLKLTRVFNSSSAATAAGYTVQDSSNATAVVATKLFNVSVGGSFLQTDVIGNPANILATPQLANGWQGSWIQEIPDGLKDYFTFARKYVGSGVDITRTYTLNNGDSWTSGVILLTNIPLNQSQFENMPSNQVTLYQYRAFAKQTENAVNDVVYGGDASVGKVYATSNYQEHGNLLGESLIGRVLTNNSDVRINTLSLNTCALQNSKDVNNFGKLSSAEVFGGISHKTLSLASPANNSPAFKVLNYNVNINKQAFIQYAYTELKHNGTNWGDDSKITIVDNQATKTDLNGNTVLVGTARLKEPIGWIKNKV
ncbi:hypothetical protein [Shewanella decolorationis]|uniref:hypothetical protein n=1 Tax=Shewanella decolorationis TaxID=256839 RepID=UPI0010573A49|nr:hypothetical protein [Shewanella decolorationis]